jgi:hypothetical protein
MYESSFAVPYLILILPLLELFPVVERGRSSLASFIYFPREKGPRPPLCCGIRDPFVRKWGRPMVMRTLLGQPHGVVYSA